MGSAHAEMLDKPTGREGPPTKGNLRVLVEERRALPTAPNRLAKGGNLPLAFAASNP